MPAAEMELTPNEIEEEKIRKIINGKMRNTRKRPHTIERQKDIYDMSSPVRGYCLIFSNHVFKTLDKLTGYEMDKNYLQTVFEELHFKCKIFEKFTAEDLRQQVKRYANKSASGGKYPTNALVVVVLSHGCQKYLYGYNFDDKCPEASKDKIMVDELQEICSNKNCPSMINKPKMFFVQACRGRNCDYGLNDYAREESSSVIASPALRSGKVRKFVVDKRINLPSSFEDVWVSYATTPNYISYVREGTGSVFGVQLCKELKQWAWLKSLNDIMISVTSAISQKDILTKNGKYGKQVVQNVTTGWKGKLFFNPGYSKDRTENPTSNSPSARKLIVENVNAEQNVDVINQASNLLEKLDPIDGSGSTSSILEIIGPLSKNTRASIKRKIEEKGDSNHAKKKMKKEKLEKITLNKITKYFLPIERNEADIKNSFSRYEFSKKIYKRE